MTARLALGALAALLLASHAAASYKVWEYSNPAVVAGPVRVDVMSDIIKYSAPGIAPVKTASQPSPLSPAIAYVIMANLASYSSVEGLGSNPAKLAELKSWVMGGGALILADGYKDGYNWNVWLLDALLDTPTGCAVSTFPGSEINMKLRYTKGAYGSLPSEIKVKTGQGISSMTCTTGTEIYSAWVNNKQVATSFLWPLGEGYIVWVGSSFEIPHLKGYEEVVAATIQTAADVPVPTPSPTEKPTSPPPPPKSPPPPPKSSPPPPPPTSSPPPPPTSSPPPPPVDSPPPTSSPPPPLVDSPPPTSSPPPPLVDSPPPPTSSPPPPPTSSPPPPRPPPPSPPPPKQSPPPPPEESAPPPFDYEFGPPPYEFPSPPPSPPKPPKKPKVTGRRLR